MEPLCSDTRNWLRRLPCLKTTTTLERNWPQCSPQGAGTEVQGIPAFKEGRVWGGGRLRKKVVSVGVCRLKGEERQGQYMCNEEHLYSCVGLQGLFLPLPSSQPTFLFKASIALSNLSVSLLRSLLKKKPRALLSFWMSGGEPEQTWASYCIWKNLNSKCFLSVHTAEAREDLWPVIGAGDGETGMHASLAACCTSSFDLL